MLFSGCAPQPHLRQLPTDQFPVFKDEPPRELLLIAIERQLNYLDSQSAAAENTISAGEYRNQAESLRTFRRLLQAASSPLALNQLIRQHFKVYEAAGRSTGPPGDILLTGYYEPLFAGSLRRDEQYRYPLYAIPPDLVRRDSGNGRQAVGRLDREGNFHPYWSRQDIETEGLLAGQELVYLRDPLDAYLLHVQGSGRIRLPDGLVRSVRFAGSNGREYNSLGKLFVDRQLMKREEVSIPRIRAYFEAHPQELAAMLHHNPRYIFFQWGDGDGPRGSLGDVLTPGRSVAADQNIFPVGAIGYLVSRRPVLDRNGQIDHWQPLHRFVLIQDSGAAIKGPGRIDLFWGAGRYAETAASHMNETGKFYLLLQNTFELAREIR